MRELEKLYHENHEAMVDWLRQEAKPVEDYKKFIPFSSIDIRNAGFKLVPVDSNLFPSGFNNFSEASLDWAKERFRNYIKLYYPAAKKILLYPEQFTRNNKYLSNLEALCRIMQNAGIEVTILLHPEIFEELSFANKVSSDAVNINQYDLIILNNDLTTGIPDFLQDVKIPIMPDLMLGWHHRSKYQHFELYDSLIKKIALKFGFDDWLLNAEYDICQNVNFKSKTNLDSLAIIVENVIAKIRLKYAEYGIKQEPYVFVKANKGTFGLGVMIAKSAEDILHINKKSRNSMHSIKYGVVNDTIIIQEGVPTIETIEKAPAENLIYSIGGEPIGMFTRYNSYCDIYNSLNAPGMGFTKSVTVSKDNLSYLLSIISYIANLLEYSHL